MIVTYGVGDVVGRRVPLPRLTTEQRRDALNKALVIRRKRGALLAAVRAGVLSVAEVLERAGDPVVAGTRIGHLVRAVPGLGEVGAAKVCATVGVAEHRCVRGLGRRQRERLLELMALRRRRRQHQP